MDTTFPTPRQLKDRARQLLREAAPRPRRVTVLYWLLGTALTALISYIAALFLPTAQDTVSAPEFFLSLLLGLFGIVLAYGYDRWIFWTSRGKELDAGTLLDGFSEVGRIILARIWTALYLLPWVFLLSIASTLVLFLLSNLFVSVFLSLGPVAFLTLLLLFVGAVYLILYAIALRYELVHFLLAEFDQLTPTQAVRRSAQLMQGQTGRLFCLKLSFLGWRLLALALSFGVLLAAAAPQLQNLLQLLEQGAEAELAQYLAQLQLFLGGSWPSLLAMLVQLPVFLFLTPYQRMAEAQFYSRLTRPDPDLPPW